jgi:hypothetical protein
MSYEFKHRGDMWFGNVYDVYESNEWIGGVMQGKQDPRWSSVTPSGRGAEPLPFGSREEAAAWLDTQGERVPRSRKWRYSPPAYAILGPVISGPAMGDYEKVTRGKHLFGGVYETYANGELIGVTKQGRRSPWWTPEVRPAVMGDNGTDFQWSEPRGLHWTDIALYVVLPLWVLSAALPVIAKMREGG